MALDYFLTCTRSSNLDSVAEVASGILCACLPVLPRFLQHFRQSKKNIGAISYRHTTRAVAHPPSASALFSSARLREGELAHEYPTIPQGVVLGWQGHAVNKDLDEERN